MSNFHIKFSIFSYYHTRQILEERRNMSYAHYLMVFTIISNYLLKEKNISKAIISVTDSLDWVPACLLPNESTCVILF